MRSGSRLLGGLVVCCCLALLAHAQGVEEAAGTGLEVEDAAAPPAPVPFESLKYLKKPSASQMEDWYPKDAKKNNMSGLVILVCEVNSFDRLQCEIAGESPAGWGFGTSALFLAENLMVPEEGQVGKWTELKFPFQLGWSRNDFRKMQDDALQERKMYCMLHGC
jgi:hypothetical protein